MLGILLATLTNVGVGVTEANDAALRGAFGLRPNAVVGCTFAGEIALIREVQQKVFAAAPINRGIAVSTPREPEDLVRLGYGLCYDRSRAIEKALTFCGFKTRHLYILHQRGRSFLPALLGYQHPSHAATEVLTSRGWVFVDSNTLWISLSRRGEVVPPAQVWEHRAEFASLPTDITGPYWTIRGLYSRNGNFYPPYIPFPDLNWPDFLSSLVH